MMRWCGSTGLVPGDAVSAALHKAAGEDTRAAAVDTILLPQSSWLMPYWAHSSQLRDLAQVINGEDRHLTPLACEEATHLNDM